MALIARIFPVVFLMAGSLNAQQVPESLSAASAEVNRSTAPVGFEENKGQVVSTSGAPAPYVRYRMSAGNTMIFLLDQGIAYQFNRIHAPEGYRELQGKTHRTSEEERKLEALRSQLRLETFRMDMELEGADPHARISSEGRSTDHSNYYRYGAFGVRTFRRVVYHEVYPGIDWAIHTTERGFEYDFIVRPGGDPSRIKVRFKDHEELFLEGSGDLAHGNRLGRFEQAKPVSLQEDTEIPTRFHLEGDLLTFEVGAYDRHSTLLIDPTCEWGTYYGGAGEDHVGQDGLAVDADGFVYVAGWTFTDIGIATAGTQDQLCDCFNGDAMLVKFNPAGGRVWGTYYGGSDADAFASCKMGPDGSVIAAGVTKSTADVATAPLDNEHGGWVFGGGEANCDGLLVKFDTANGLRQWATYCGGAQEDRARSCAVDDDGNIYVTGMTKSAAGIPLNALHQPVYGDGQDAFLMKFNTNGVKQWGTYYGGNSLEDALGCAVDPVGNAYIAGGAGFSNSGNAISTAGSPQFVYGGGGSEAFLAKFDPNGSRLWGTWYGGNSSDYGFACAADPSGNVFLVGDTYSTNGNSIASPTDAHQIGQAGGSDAFLVKFNAAGTLRLWGTYYGGASNEDGRGCRTDNDGNAYLVGATSSGADIATPGACHPAFGGAPADAYLVRFRPNGTRDFGTYYGGEANDFGVTSAVDQQGGIYLTGDTYSGEGIYDPPGFRPTLGGGADVFLAKFLDTPDCMGVYAGTALPGTPCDDESDCTINDVYTGTAPNCGCAGEVVDTDDDEIPDCTDDCPTVPGEIGSTCNDGIACTTNEVLNASCVCTGTVVDTDGDGICNPQDDCPTMPGEQGDPCNDTDVCTINDVLNASCVCAGTFQDTDDDGTCNANDNCPTIDGQQGSPCNDDNACTDNDVLNLSCVCAGTLNNTDSDNDGVPNCSDNCPDEPGQVGSACNDGADCTTGDVLNSNCVCTGSSNSTDTDGDGTPDCADDCPTVIGQQGSPCNDSNACTDGDALNGVCDCVGTVNNADNDSDGVPNCTDNCPNVTGEQGDVCDDGVVCTINDVLSAVCVCAGISQDTDSDGICNVEDDCPTVPGQQGDPCDDLDPVTFNDQINGACQCAGSTQDCLNVPGGTALPGTACEALNACIINEVWNAQCECEGEMQEPGSVCDDDLECTINDVFATDCACAGTPVFLGAIQGNSLLANDNTIDYTYTVMVMTDDGNMTPVPNADYLWELPGTWSSDDLASSSVDINVEAWSTSVELCVDATLGGCDQLHSCVTVFVSDVGLSDPVAGGSMCVVRPNPSDGRFELVRTGPAVGQVRYSIEDATGRQCSGGTITASSSWIDLGDSPPGVYVLRVRHEGGSQDLRLVVYR